VLSPKKADVAEHPWVFDHVGLLVNEPVAAATCPSSSHPTQILTGARMERLRAGLTLGVRRGESKWLSLPGWIMMLPEARMGFGICS